MLQGLKSDHRETHTLYMRKERSLTDVHRLKKKCAEDAHPKRNITAVALPPYAVRAFPFTYAKNKHNVRCSQNQ